MIIPRRNWSLGTCLSLNHCLLLRLYDEEQMKSAIRMVSFFHCEAICRLSTLDLIGFFLRYLAHEASRGVIANIDKGYSEQY